MKIKKDRSSAQTECRLNEMEPARDWAKWAEDMLKACHTEAEFGHLLLSIWSSMEDGKCQ